MAKAKPSTKMETSIEVILSMDFEEGMESMNLTLISSMKESGRKTFFMGKASCFVKDSCSLMDSSKMD